MAKRKVNKNGKIPDQVNEPAVEYKAIRFFSSMDEMTEHDAMEMAALSPLEHMKNATELIKRVFAKELKKNFSDYTIHFK